MFEKLNMLFQFQLKGWGGLYTVGSDRKSYHLSLVKSQCLTMLSPAEETAPGSEALCCLWGTR